MRSAYSYLCHLYGRASILSEVFYDSREERGLVRYSFSENLRFTMTPTAVLLTVLGYIAMLFVVAGIAGRRVSNTGFFTGNRENPWYVAALAMVGAAMSGITFVSVPGSVAADSFSYLQMVLGFTVGQMVIAFVLIPLFYRLKVVSLYEYLDGRFGMTTHLTGAWFFFISKMFAAALKVYVVCTVLQVLVFDPFGVPFAVNAAFLVGLVWLYTWRGGVRSVVWTDILHTCCLVGSIVLCIVFIMRSLGLTSAGVVQAVCDSPMSRIFFFEDTGSARYFWKMFFGGCLHAGRHDRFGSGYDAAELELPLAPGFADQHRDYGLQPDGCDPAFSGARRAALPLCRTCWIADARERRSTVRRSRRERRIAAYRWYYVRCGTYIEYLFICRGCHDGIDDFVHRGYLARSEALGRRAVDAGTYRGARRNGTRDGVCGSLFRPVR